MTEWLKTKKVLVADNSPVMTKIIMNNLVELGFAKENIFISNTGNQTSMMLDLERFDLITSGFHMSQKNGVELLRGIRENENTKNLPFLVITAERDERYIKQLTDLGGTGYLKKPFTKAQIRSAVREIFQDEISAPEEEEVQESGPKTASKNLAELSVKPAIIQPFIECAIESVGQYMVIAEADTPVAENDFRGFFSASIDLSDTQNSVILALILNFPEKLACDIYEGIFGEVNPKEVCGVVQELVNIIGGAVKPKLVEVSSEVIHLIHSSSNSEGAPLDLSLGLPNGQMGEGNSLDIDDKEAPRFTIPFKVNEDRFTLTVVFQKL